MRKKLSEMSLEELWQIFPIILEEHKDYWKEWYKLEEKKIIDILPQKQLKRISHIGSTSVEGIWAKPIIDILVEVSQDCDMSKIKNILVECGYTCMSECDGRISFNKGYTEDGFAQKVYHLHLRYAGDNNELFFRDYLKEHSDIAKEYETLKLSLWKKFEHNRDAYTNAKTEFILNYTKEAKRIYANKY